MILKLEEKIHLLNACSAQALCSVGGAGWGALCQLRRLLLNPNPEQILPATVQHGSKTTWKHHIHSILAAKGSVNTRKFCLPEAGSLQRARRS